MKRFTYVIKSRDPTQDRDSTVLVTITVDPATVKPQLISAAWLAERSRMVARMADSPENRAHLREYSEAIVARELSDGILDRAYRAHVIEDPAPSANRYRSKCHATGRPIAEGAGFAGIDWFTGRKVYYSWRAIVARFSAVGGSDGQTRTETKSPSKLSRTSASAAHRARRGLPVSQSAIGQKQVNGK